VWRRPPVSEATTVEEYEGNGVDWNELALSHPEVRMSHLWQYGQVIQETYGFEAHGFVVKRGGKIIALVPASLTRSMLYGRRLVSQPYSEYGGILASEASEADVGMLAGYLKRFCDEKGVSQVELHGSPGVSRQAVERNFAAINPYGYAVLDLCPDPERLRTEVFEHQVRKAVQKAERNNVTSYEDSRPETIRETFYPLFLESMKRLGSPPHPPAYFLNLKKRLPDEMKIFWAAVHGEPVSALLGFAVGERIQLVCTASKEEHWHLRPNDLVHWEFIKYGCLNGVRKFDFGSVRYEGQMRYKKKWGARHEQSGYLYMTGLPRKFKTFNSSSRLMTSFARNWSRFVPISWTRVLGPYLRKQLVR